MSELLQQNHSLLSQRLCSVITDIATDRTLGCSVLENMGHENKEATTTEKFNKNNTEVENFQQTI